MCNCDNGLPATGDGCDNGQHRCESCHAGFALNTDNSACVLASPFRSEITKCVSNKVCPYPRGFTRTAVEVVLFLLFFVCLQLAASRMIRGMYRPARPVLDGTAAQNTPISAKELVTAGEGGAAWRLHRVRLVIMRAGAGDYGWGG